MKSIPLQAMTQVLQSILGAHLASPSNVLCCVLFDGMSPNNGIIVQLRAKPSLGVFLSPPSPANRSRLHLPRHPGERPAPTDGLTHPFLLPESRHRARGDVRHVTMVQGKEGGHPFPGGTTVTAALHCARSREEQQPSRRCATVTTSVSPRATLAPTRSCLAWHQGGICPEQRRWRFLLALRLQAGWISHIPGGRSSTLCVPRSQLQIIPSPKP